MHQLGVGELPFLLVLFLFDSSALYFLQCPLPSLQTGWGWRDLEDSSSPYLFIYLWPRRLLAGSYFPGQGLNLRPRQRKRGVVTIGPPGNPPSPLLGRILPLFLGKDSMRVGGTCLTCAWLFIFGMSMKTEGHIQRTQKEQIIVC